VERPKIRRVLEYLRRSFPRSIANQTGALITSASLSTASAAFRCTLRVDCGQLDPSAVIRPGPGEWHPHIHERLDHEELADWRAGRDAVYQLAALAALTVGARLAVVDM
jgi:hypothetical protein